MVRRRRRELLKYGSKTDDECCFCGENEKKYNIVYLELFLTQMRKVPPLIDTVITIITRRNVENGTAILADRLEDLSLNLI